MSVINDTQNSEFLSRRELRLQRLNETSKRSFAASLLSGITLTITVLLAVLAAAWMTFSMVTGSLLMVFKTGSMSPEMPQGSLAITMPVPASEIALGDVITVQRDDAALPVTHRVVEIQSGTTAENRYFYLKGDANEVRDLFPYLSDETHRVVFHIPEIGNILGFLQQPSVLITLLGVAVIFMIWAFWPRRARRVPKHRRSRYEKRRQR